MELLVIDPIHSVSDVITNSSSELFVIAGDYGDGKYIDEIVSKYTCHFKPAFKFNLKKYKEERSKRKDSLYSYCSPYSIAHEWFVDETIPHQVLSYLRYRYCSIPSFNRILESFDKLYDILYYSDDPEWDSGNKAFDRLEKIALNLAYYLMNICSTLRIREREKIEYLDGKYLLITDDDNSVDYHILGKVQSIFSCTRVHLG